MEIEHDTLYSTNTTEAKKYFDRLQNIREPKRIHRFSVEESDETRHTENLTELVLKRKQSIKHHGIDLMSLVSCGFITLISVSACFIRPKS